MPPVLRVVMTFEDGVPVDYIVEDINLSCESMLGLKREDVAGRRGSELYKDKIPLLNEVAEVVLSGVPRQFEQYNAELHKHFWVSVTPWGENRFGIVFSDLTQMMHTQMLQNTLSAAANEMSGSFETAKVFGAVARVLKQNGFECMLLLTDNDLSVSKTFLSFADVPRVYRDESCLVLSGAFLQAARQKCAIYIDDFNLPPSELNEVGLRDQLRGIATPLLVNAKVFGVFVILSDGIKPHETSVVKVFADLMGVIMERTALIQSLKRHIDELTQSRLAHEQTTQRLNMASSASTVGFWEYDLERHVAYIDETTRQIIDTKEKVFFGVSEPWRTIAHPEDHSAVMAAFKRAVQFDGDCTTEFRVVRSDGAIRYVRNMGMICKDENGVAVRMVGSVWDITDRKRIEEALKASERQLNKIFDLLPVGLWVADKDGHIVKTNPAGELIWEGILTEAEPASRISRYPSGEGIEPEEWALCKTVKQGVTTHNEMLEIETLKGSRKIILNSTAPVTDENGRLQAAIMINRDVTGNENAKAALEAEKELLSITLQSIGEGVVVTDNQGVITAVNEVFEKICGCTQRKSKGLMFEHAVKAVNSRGIPRPSLIEKTLETGQIISRSKGVELVCEDGRIVPIAHTVSPIRDGNGQIIGTVTVMRDITEEKKKQKRIDYLVYHDALTGVYNRRYFDQILKKIDTKQNLPISVINCDVNGLKLTNDAFGHSTGDKLLIRMASVLLKACRRGDIVVRSGGDEFMILMPQADEIMAQKVCADIKMQSAKSYQDSIDCSISVGSDTKKHPDESLKTIINKAEAYMYRNKSLESPRMRFSSINTILLTLHEKCANERLHCHHVSQICAYIAKAMGLSEREIAEISLIGRMHDIGKIAVNHSLFSKPEKLTEAEWVDMKRHPEVGFRILSASTDMAYIANSVLAHHERFDGSGYPNGLKGSQIPMTARILTVADAFEAMTNERPYRKTKTREQALSEMADFRGTQFDPFVVDVFLKINDSLLC